MPMTTRVANKTKRPALVVIQARSPKKTRRKLTSRKQKEAPPETGIEHISEIETRQAEIHTDTSNATPAATTRATRPRRGTATAGAVVTQKKGSRHALKLQNGPKNGGISSAEADFKEDADSNSEELEEPPAVPTSWENTQRESAPRETYKEVRTAIEARKLQRVANQAQRLVVNKNQDQELANGTITGTGGQAMKFTSDQEPSNRPSTKRAHVYDLTDPNTPAIRSPVAKRTRGSRFEDNSKTSTRQAVPKINWNSQLKLTKRANATVEKPTVRPPIEAGTDNILDSREIDTSVDLFQADGEYSRFQAYEHGNRFEGTDDAADDRHNIRAKQRVESSDQLTWMGGRDTATNAAVESNDDKTGLSSEISSSEYEPSELGKSESAFDEVDSDTGRPGFRKSPDDKSVPIPPDRYHMRSPFLNELYEDYKEWHRRSDDEDDRSSIHIRRGYYGDSLPDGSQPLEDFDSFEVHEAQKFDVLSPGRNISGENALAGRRTSNFLDTETPNNKKREGESESIPGDELMFPPNYHGVYHERPSTTINETHSLPGDEHVKRGESRHIFNSRNSQVHGWADAPPCPPPMAAASRAKGKERADHEPLSGQFSYSQADHLRLASRQSNEIFNVVNDFGGMSDRDEDREGEEYLHAKSSPLKDGRRLDNQFIVQINDTPKARPGNIKRGIKRQSKKAEDTSEFESKRPADSKIRTHVKNQHLPSELTHPVDTWKSVVLPTFFNWLASQEDPWNQSPSAIVEVLESICRANVRGSYSLKRDGDTSGVKSAEYKRVAQKISDWKSKLGSTAIWAVNTIFECKPEEFRDSDDARVAWADWHQEGCRFLFADVETIPPKGIFQSNVFLHVLGAHFAIFAIDEKAWVPGLTHDSLSHEPWGAIAIAAAAVERAVVLWSNRNLTVEIMKRAARSKSHSIEFPKKMNTRGVETQSHALFAEPKWGPRTQYYYRNIKVRVKKGTWNWPEIYNLLGPHIKALRKREKSKPKVQKPVSEVADFEDDDLLEDAADMTLGGSLSSQPALSKPWISKQFQSHPTTSHQTPQWQSASNPGLAQGPLSSQPITGTRRSPYSHEVGTRLLAASAKRELNSNSSHEATAHTTSTLTAQPLHCPTRHRPSLAPEAPINSRESLRPSRYPQELRSETSRTTIPFEPALRRSQHHSEPISSTGSAWAETPSMNHSQQYQPRTSQYNLNSSRRPTNSDNYLYHYSSVQDAVSAGMMPTTTPHIRKGPAPSILKHHHSQPEAGPSRRR